MNNRLPGAPGWWVQHLNAVTVSDQWRPLKGQGNGIQDWLETPQKSSLDKGLMARPLLHPSLQIKSFDEEGFVLLFKDDWNIMLSGKLYVDILPLLNGRNDCDKLVEQLQKHDHSEIAVKTVLYRLSSKGLIVSGEHSLTREQSQWWGSRGVTPVRAEQLLLDLPIFFKTLPGIEADPGLFERMSSWGGWKLVDSEEEAGLSVYLMTCASEDELYSINKGHLSSGKKWCFLQVTDRGVLYTSPIFHPSCGPCWECLAFRLKRGASRILQKWSTPPSSPFLMGESLLENFHVELSEYLVNPSEAPLRDHLIRSVFPHVKGTYHWVNQRPQCRACGNSVLKDPSRSPEELQLQSQPLECISGGGVRHRTHEEVWQHYKKFLDPVTGASGTIDNYVEETGGVFISSCDTNFAVQQWSFEGVKAGFRDKSGGKGMNLEQAQVGALCESLERYSGCFQGEEEIVHRAKYRDFPSGDAIAPNEVMLFSDRQFANREEINSRQIRFYQVPLPFSKESDEQLDWTPVWSLSEKRFKYMMTQQLYYNFNNGADKLAEYYYAVSDSNGCAGGSCLEDAIIQGMYELIERDAVAMWWYNRLQFPAIDLDSFDMPWLQKTRNFYESNNWHFWALDITNDFGVPCFVSLAAQKNGDPNVILGLGCHSDPSIALSRAVTELNQFWVALSPWVSERSLIHQKMEPSLLEWFQEANPYEDSNYRYLLPNDRPSMVRGNYPHTHFGDALEAIACLQSKVEDRGMEMLVLNQTRPDIGYPTVKVIVPGMRHFWYRTAPGRLYDIPVKMGWMDRPLHEEELNPTPMFI